MWPIREVVKKMKILHTTWYATFVVTIDDEGRSIEDKALSVKDVNEISGDLLSVSNGEILQREKELADRYEINVTTDARCRSLVTGNELFPSRDLELPSPMDLGFDMSLLAEASAMMARMAVSEGPDDSTIMSGVGSLTDIDSSLNLITERLREWYSKYWEGASDLLEDPAVLNLIVDDPNPATVHSRLDMEGVPPPEREAPDLAGMSPLAKLALSLWEAREKTERYLETEMGSTAPCLSEVAGPLIGARLIHSASGLMRLAKLPSSTVQVLGAEKMFFKFLKEGGKPPKHGVLFQHPWVHSLPQKKRGKMARSIASAAALAARMDAYGGGDPGPLKKKLEERRDRIISMDEKKSTGGGRQPPFREGWWAGKPIPKKGHGNRHRGRRKRK